MAKEIERKFLVQPGWKANIKELSGQQIRQGYLSCDPERTVRVRLKGNMGFLTIKGKTDGISRQEFEYSIPAKDAEALLLLCEGPLIEKERFTFMIGQQQWEVDEFFGDNAGLILAEAELLHEQQALEIPEWITEEVSHDRRYYNAQLSQKPFCSW